MKKKMFIITLLSITLVGCVKQQSKYQWVKDVDHMNRVEAAASRSAQPVETYWINPPKKKVKRDN
ncbi:MAG: hypothetical protein OQJ89_01385 [Kangiellaceae bacterium]|nr:hypothetical protein [Kangiellaceae bacterium]MCW9000399.1 hypothetical protein [Kangiellaceae bacterium]MCW9015595.1 hypothetical protein [Kangiellaceae bacterium]